MSKSIFLIIIYYLLFINVFAQKRDTVKVADFGALPDTYGNAVMQVQKAIESCRLKQNPILVFQNGRYDFWPDGAVRAKYFISNTTSESEYKSKIITIGMLIKNLKNLTVEGNDALFIFHGNMTPFVVDNSENITFHNFHEDYERPAMSEMQVVNITDNYIDFRVNPDAKYEIKKGELTWYGEGWKTTFFHCLHYSKKTEFVKYSSWDYFKKSRAEELELNLIRFHNINNLKPYPELGDIYGIRDVIRDKVGFHIRESKNVTLDDVKLHYLDGLGVVSQYSENITFKKLVSAPRKETGRIFASSADFLHFSGCKGLILIDSCYCSGAQDDPINVHTTHLRIIKKISPNKILVRFMHEQSYGFNAFFAGDDVNFINAKSLTSYSSSKVLKVERINDYDIELTLKNIPGGIEYNSDCVENAAWAPDVIIRNSRFEHVNTRGLLLTSRKKIVVENNVFFRTGMSAILISDDASSWYEGSMVNDLTIRNNEFIDCGYNGGHGNANDAIIAIYPENKEINYSNPVHRNIVIEGNTFKTFDYPVLHAKSVQNLIFRNNKIIQTFTVQPRSSNKYTFDLVACSNVILENNIYDSSLLGKNIFLELMLKKELTLIGEDKDLSLSSDLKLE